jgi:hypothetical protein
MLLGTIVVLSLFGAVPARSRVRRVIIALTSLNALRGAVSDSACGASSRGGLEAVFVGSSLRTEIASLRAVRACLLAGVAFWFAGGASLHADAAFLLVDVASLRGHAFLATGDDNAIGM